MTKRIVTFCNLKGGAGKTTLCAAVGTAMAAHWKVLAVDLDDQRSLLDWQGRASELGRARVTVVGSTPKSLAKSLPTLAEGFDVVLVDTAARLGADARAALMVASLAVVPVSPGFTDLCALGPTLQTIEEAQAFRPFGVLGVLNRADQRVFSRIMREEVDAAGLTLADASVRNYDAFPSSMADGQGVTTWDPDSNAAHDIRRLADELARRLGLEKKLPKPGKLAHAEAR